VLAGTARAQRSIQLAADVDQESTTGAKLDADTSRSRRSVPPRQPLPLSRWRSWDMRNTARLGYHRGPGHRDVTRTPVLRVLADTVRSCCRHSKIPLTKPAHEGRVGSSGRCGLMAGVGRERAIMVPDTLHGKACSAQAQVFTCSITRHRRAKPKQLDRRPKDPTNHCGRHRTSGAGTLISPPRAMRARRPTRSHGATPTTLDSRGAARHKAGEANVPEIRDEVALARPLRALADRLLATASEDMSAIEGRGSHRAVAALVPPRIHRTHFDHEGARSADRVRAQFSTSTTHRRPGYGRPRRSSEMLLSRLPLLARCVIDRLGQVGLAILHPSPHQRKWARRRAASKMQIAAGFD
jgi:Domain of unknown function (DUF1876)